ncbi:MAG: adenosylcobinamide-GDP ribazoletransferase, partial [Gammaproteobacteria bacterium]|nr:adenosylcobinamide-GDP ribazoletransferase [Gammaproteobacteria bacterium]
MLSVAGTRWRPKSVVIMAPLGKKSGLRAAVGFLTILPVSPRDTAALAHARAYFPLVGLVLGALLVGLDLLLSGWLFLPEGMFIAL